MNKRGGKALVLEGGGVKCAYQLGFLRALKKLPEFDAVFGASFGALGAARLIGGGIGSLEEFWSRLTANEMFASREASLFMHGLYANEKGSSVRALIKALSAYGLSAKGHADLSANYHAFVMQNVDEASVRASGKKLGFVVSEVPAGSVRRFIPGFFSAACETERGSKQARPVYLTLDSIPPGRLPEYVAASACFPAFLPVSIDGRLYIDGGLCDNAPVSMAEEYEKVLCIHTNHNASPDVSREGLVSIVPSRELGSCVLFDRENIDELILLGEHDAIQLDKGELAPFYE